MATQVTPQKKKIPFKLYADFQRYLADVGRIQHVDVQYNDLLRFTDSISLYDKKGNDTLWLTVSYPQGEMEELNKELTIIYAALKTNGDVKVMASSC